MRFQLAFQGGGARIAALLAAAEAIQELISEGEEIEITNVAGTSAGAIVGAFLAANVSISQIRTQLAGDIGRDLLAKFVMPSKPMVWWKIYHGTPFWPDEYLRKWLSGHFSKLRKEAPPRLRDISGRGLFVVASNISTGEPKKYGLDDDLVTSLLDSSGLPFCFRSWAGANNSVIVDGGLCENLPVDDLVAKTSTDGRILGFSFSRISPGNPNNALGFASGLIDIAINNSVQIARNRLGADSVYTIDTSLMTFDFQKARDFLSSDYYEKTKDSVKEWIKDIIKKAIPAPSRTIDYWWKDENPHARLLMSTIGRVYASQHEIHKVSIKSLKFIVTCNCLAEFGHEGHNSPDGVLYELTIAAIEHPVFAHRLTLSTPSDSELYGNYVVKVFDERGEPVSFNLAPSITPDSPKDRALIVFFDKPLLPGAMSYKISIHDVGKNLMTGFQKSGREDGLCASLSRLDGAIGKLLFGLHVPSTFSQLSVSRVTENLASHQLLKDGAAVDEVGYPPVNFRTHALAASNVVNAKYLEVYFKA